MSISELESSAIGDSSELPEHLASLSNDELRQHIRAIDNEIRIMKSEINRIKHETSGHTQHIKENKEKIRVNKQLPYLVANVVELVEPYVDPKEDDGSATDLSVTSTMKGLFLVIIDIDVIILGLHYNLQVLSLRPLRDKPYFSQSLALFELRS